MFRSIGYNLARLTDFSGRESRGLYWPYAISVFVLAMLAGLLLMVPVMTDMMERMVLYMQAHPEGLPKPAPGQPPVFPPELMPDIGRMIVPLAIVNLVSLLFYAAATVRRLHDRDRTGWWAALPLPFQLLGVLIGPRAMEAMLHPGAAPSPLATLSSLNSLLYWAAFIYLIVLLAGEATKGPTRFGEPPALS
jgi:uncharacterized membrane protein YhaH (DUF805 family)